MPTAYPTDIWDSRRLLATMENLTPEVSFFKDFFSTKVLVEEEYLDLEKIDYDGDRYLAQLVHPLAVVNGTRENGSSAYRFKPAYIKIEDTIDPLRALGRLPSYDSMLGEDAAQKNKWRSRMGAMKAKKLNKQRQYIGRREEWMSARALVDAQLTVAGPGLTTKTVDFFRDPSLTIVKGAGSRWGDSGVKILDDLNTYIDLLFKAPFGQRIATDIVMGGRVWDAMAPLVKTGGELEPWFNQLRREGVSAASAVDFPTDPLKSPERVQMMGTLTIKGKGDLNLWVHREWYLDDSGTMQYYLPQNTMLMHCGAQNLSGYDLRGRIFNQMNDFAPAAEIYVSNWIEKPNTPAQIEMVRSETSPLFVPLAPNTTLKAVVVA